MIDATLSRRLRREILEVVTDIYDLRTRAKDCGLPVHQVPHEGGLEERLSDLLVQLDKRQDGTLEEFLRQLKSDYPKRRWPILSNVLAAAETGSAPGGRPGSGGVVHTRFQNALAELREILEKATINRTVGHAEARLSDWRTRTARAISLFVSESAHQEFLAIQSEGHFKPELHHLQEAAARYRQFLEQILISNR